MNAYLEARCPFGHKFRWLTGTPFICPACGHKMYGVKEAPPTLGMVPPYVKTVLLTQREGEVAGLIAEGLSNRQIADALVIQEATVENHIHHILCKLNLEKRMQIARLIWKHAMFKQPQEPAEEAEE